MGDVNKSVEVKLGAKLGPEVGAAFKAVQEHAAKTSRSVKDMAAPAKTTSDVLKKMMSDYKDGLRASEVQTNRLAKSIKELGLTTKDVTALAKQMGQQWNLTTDQINKALTQAGRAKMGGGGWFGGGGGGGHAAMFLHGLIGGGDIRSLAREGLVGAGAGAAAGLASGALVKGGAMAAGGLGGLGVGAGALGFGLGAAGLGLGAFGAFAAADLAPEATGNFVNWFSRAERAKQAAIARGEKQLAARLDLEMTRGEQIAIKAPFLDQIRADKRNIAGMQDQAAGLRGLAGVRSVREADLRGTGVGQIMRGAALAPEVFKGAAGQEQLRGLREQVGERAKGQAAAEAVAANEVAVAQQQVNRLAREENAIRRMTVQTWAEQAEKDRQLLQIGEQRKQAEQALLAIAQQHNQTKRQGMQQELQSAKSLEGMYRNIAVQERERLQQAKEGFGLQEPNVKREAVDVAKRLAGGRDLTREQLQLAQGMPIFQDALRQYGEKRAGPEWQEIVRLIGATRKAEQAEKAGQFFADIKVKLENSIKVEIAKDEQAQAQALVDKVIPLLKKQEQDLLRAMDTKIQQAWLAQRAGQAAAAGPRP